MTKLLSLSGAADFDTTIRRVERLEQLAAWHRLNAEHAGSDWIWKGRLRMAEDLERQAAQLRTLTIDDSVSGGEVRPSP